MTIKKEETKKVETAMDKLFNDDKAFTKLPEEGDIVEGTVISIEKKEVLLDINGVMTGIIRGKELFNESSEFADLKPGDKTEATVVDLDNELGMIELSFRYAGHQKTWTTLDEYKNSSTVVTAKVTDANKGGLLVSVNGVAGFLPVSQLSPEYYPRIQGGDKNKILEKLKSYVKQEFSVKVLDVNSEQEKLIVSEKASWEEAQKDLFSKYKVGDKVDGKITAVTDFGVFVQFGENLEGLIHISELAWQRIDDPRDLYKVNDELQAEIINIDGSKIFLSSKKLIADPWADVAEKYTVGDVVEGKVLKITSYGLFVELDKNIHGLAHISEMKDPNMSNIEKTVKVGELKKFKIVSIEAKEHRLGLAIAEEGKDKSEKIKEEKVEKEEESKEDKDESGEEEK
ncbi:S1 RNA-binding domain-containing protein [Candidatus Falkowbacteria bacterium]|jgi:small subunit ribosomal protein S1|nr:S1 RNA-binding domain-containing protein [Candidatus Falkowbacteria bacterium]MBT7006998.1 S1 RNA-binding domain-containing protein [Candidatus Falkowbacteria bacterium]